jgi:hypothetical protein
LIGATAGDPIKPAIRISNTRTEPIECNIRPELPQGWSMTQPAFSATVAPGENKLIEIPMVVSNGELQGQKSVKFAISEASAPIKEITLKVDLQPAIAMRVAPITGSPGETTLNIQLANSAATPRDGVLKLKLPASWKTSQPQIAVTALLPGEVREVPITFTWGIDFNAGESATVEFTDAGGKSIQRPLIPNEFSIHAASDISLNGDISNWPAYTEIPAWMLGSLVDETGARVHLAWAKEGIYAAVEVHDSKIVNHDPDSFWACDALEMFIDTAGNKSPRAFVPTDHQFWFVPQPEKNAVYAGRWKVGNEIPATESNLQGVKSIARRTADGYVMEFLLPAAVLDNYHPEIGAHLGLNLNLNICGQLGNREIFWPRSKSAGVQSQPQNWGPLTLVQ